MALPQKKPEVNPADVMEGLIIRGDLEGLTSEQRVVYYNRVCDSIGVNPLTQPFQYLKLQGKLILYATRACADQLRKLHGINIEIVSQDISDGLLTVHARAKDSTGRVDEDLGVVPFPDTLRGDVRANTILRAVTKAKRRVTLSISGLGYLDETEAEDIPGAQKATPPKPAPNVLLHNPETGEINETAAPDQAASPGAVDAAPPSDTPGDGAALTIEDMAREEARKGSAAMRTFWLNLTPAEQKLIHAIRPEINRLVDKAEEQRAYDVAHVQEKLDKLEKRDEH